MKRSYKFIDHTADIAIDLEADTLEELFIAAAEAFKVSVTDFNCLGSSDFIEIELTGTSTEELLVAFLNEINFHLDIKKWLCCNIESIKIFNDVNYWELSAEMSGIKLNPDINLKQEIKSVTYHQMEIFQAENIYRTRVVFDI